MWQRFSERARRAVYFAQDEAVRRGATEIDAEHLLLGVLRNSDNVAAFLLGEMGLSPREIYDAVAGCLPAAEKTVTGEIRFQPRAKRVIDRAAEESRRMGNRSVATEHLLLGLLADDGVAGGVLALRGVTPEKVRGAINRLVDGNGEPAGLRGRALSGLARLSDEQRILLDGEQGVPLPDLPETLQQALDELLNHAAGGGMPLRLDITRARVRLVEQNHETGPFRLTLALEGVTLSAGLAPQQRTQSKEAVAATPGDAPPSSNTDPDSGVVSAIIEDINRHLGASLSATVDEVPPAAKAKKKGETPPPQPSPPPSHPEPQQKRSPAHAPRTAGPARERDEIDDDRTYYVPPPADAQNGDVHFVRPRPIRVRE